MKTTVLSILVLSLFTVGLTACGPSQAELDATTTQVAADIFSTQTALAPTATQTFTPSPTATDTPTATYTPTPTETPQPTATPTPGLSSLALSLADFPEGFSEMPEDQRSMIESRYPAGSHVFGYGDDASSQYVIAVLFTYNTRAEQEAFDAMSPDFAQTITKAMGADQDLEVLEALDELGNSRAGVTAVGGQGALKLRWDIIVFRRDQVVTLLFVAYPDGDEPAVVAADLARTLDERVEKYLSD